jgi:hypothetical protein
VVFAPADAEYVRVDGERRRAEKFGHDHVGGLAADAGQGFQLFARARHLAAVTVPNQLCQLDDALALRRGESDAPDQFQHAFRPEPKRVLRTKARVVGVLHAGVDHLVGGLRRQDHRDQQLERRGEVKLRLRFREDLPEAPGELCRELPLGGEAQLSRIRPRLQRGGLGLGLTRRLRS